MGATTQIRARDRILEATGADADVDQVLRASLLALHDVAGFRWAAVMSVDPQTILPTAGLVEGFSPEACGPFWDMELVSPGYHKFADLARSADPVGTLYDATDGDLTRSPLYVEVYAGLGAADELRGAFRLGATCWGVGCLIRPTEDGPFPESEVEAVRNIGQLIARALRKAVIRKESGAASASAMVVVDDANRIEHLTAEGRDLLNQIRAFHYDAESENDELPGLLVALLTRARYSHASAPVVTRVQAASGLWLRVTAARTEAQDGHVAVYLEPARATDLIPMVLEGYGLTEREVGIVLYLARGLSSKEIAAELSLSPHTVRDHMKAIYRKCGATRRGELVARLFTDHVRPAFEESVVSSSGG